MPSGTNACGSLSRPPPHRPHRCSLPLRRGASRHPNCSPQKRPPAPTQVVEVDLSAVPLRVRLDSRGAAPRGALAEEGWYKLREVHREEP